MLHAYKKFLKYKKYIINKKYIRNNKKVLFPTRKLMIPIVFDSPFE